MTNFGGICWWCHWGWPKQIHDIYAEALEKLDGDDGPLNYGPAHVVWEDENWDNAQSCLDNFEKYADRERHSVRDLAIVRESLVKLIAVPDEYKIEPLDYDGDNPQNFPPPSHWVMVRS